METCGAVPAEAYHGWVWHARWYFPCCLAWGNSEDVLCLDQTKGWMQLYSLFLYRIYSMYCMVSFVLLFSPECRTLYKSNCVCDSYTVSDKIDSCVARQRYISLCLMGIRLKQCTLGPFSKDSDLFIEKRRGIDAFLDTKSVSESLPPWSNRPYRVTSWHWHPYVVLPQTATTKLKVRRNISFLCCSITISLHELPRSLYEDMVY